MYQEARQKPKVIGIRLLRSDNVEFENYELTYVRYNVRNEDLLLEERRDE